MNIKIPEGLEVPESGQVDLVTTFEVRGGELYPVAIDGVPVEAEDEGPEVEIEVEGGEGEGEAPAAPAEAGSFMSAIERAMAKPNR
jgi:hypothetical protein